MRWLLDTCVVSELTRKAPEGRVLAWLSDHASDAALSAVTLGELQYGIERMPPGRSRNQLQIWFDGLSGQFGARILDADAETWLAYGRLKASTEAIGRSQADLDLLIAATVSVHRLTLVTRNVRHFVDSGVAILNPWKD